MSKFIFFYKQQAIAELIINAKSSIDQESVIGNILTTDNDLEQAFRYLLTVSHIQRGHRFGNFQESLSGSEWQKVCYNDLLVVKQHFEKYQDWLVRIESPMDVTPLPLVDLPFTP